MSHPTPPEHSGAAISIIKVRPFTERRIVMRSPAVGVDGRIAPRHAADGGNISPALEWSAVENAGAYALIVEDPDAPRAEPFVHWIAWNIPGEATWLPEGLPNEAKLISPQGMVQGRNDQGGFGWFGPKPPPGHGLHRYYFQLFALAAPLTLESDANLRALVDTLKGETLEEGELIGTYEVPG